MLSVCRDDLEYLSVLASLPAEQTIFEYLVGCWKRGNKTRSELLKKVGDICTDSNCQKARSCLGIPPSRGSASREYPGQASRACNQLHRFDTTRTGDVPPTTRVSTSLLPFFVHQLNVSDVRLDPQKFSALSCRYPRSRHHSSPHPYPPLTNSPRQKLNRSSKTSSSASNPTTNSTASLALLFVLSFSTRVYPVERA